MVRVGDVLMGVDKLCHFVVEGWEYFETAQLDGEGVAAAMEWGERLASALASSNDGVERPKN